MITRDEHYQEVLKLRDELQAKGYDLAIANFDCYDVRQNYRDHYLSWQEALALNSANVTHPVDLNNYVNNYVKGTTGLYCQYTFPQG